MIKKASKKEAEIPLELRLLTMDEVGKILGIKSDVTLYKLMDAQKVLPYRKIGKSRKFKLEDINNYLENILVSPTKS